MVEDGSVRIEKCLDVGQVDENAARRQVLVYDGDSAWNASARRVIDWDLLTIVVEKRKLIQLYEMTRLRVLTTEYSTFVFSDYGGSRDVVPTVNFGEP